ncbi:hypothetical protein CF319_g1789 [Tilletia indica]|nr:hypothetical protein CF319_g1789 [Tilletia indica]
MTGSTSTDDAPDVINASLVSVDLDDVSTEKLREAIVERDGHLRRISTQLEDLQAAHTDLLQRSAAWKDELEIAKTAASSSGANGQSPPIAAPLLPSEPSEAEGSSSSTSTNGPTSTTESALREEITQLRSANSALEDQVRDLRIRSEESRRAIMRLQNEQSDIRAKAKAENRRSLAAVGPGAFSTWNPAALASSMADADEARELRKSKRASLAFGPNAGVARTSYVPTTTYAHRRTGSGSSTGTSSAAAALSTPGLNIDAGSNPESESEADAPIGSSPSPQPSPAINQNGTSRGSMRMSGGLRGLRLSGIISSGTGASLSAPNLDDDKLPGSRRSSFTPSSQARSPVSEISETAASENGDVGFGSRQRMSYTGGGARPAAPHRQMSSDSIHSNGTAAGDDNLGLPGTARPFSVSPSPSLHSKMGSPILEEHDGGMRIKDLDDTLDAGNSPQSRFSTLTGLRKGSNSGGTRPALAPAAAAMAAQAELQSEVDRLKRELVKAKNDFEEAEEARSASEECLRALKEFIAKHDGEEDGGRRGSDAPPPPAKDGGMRDDNTPSTPKRTSTLSSGQTAALKGLKLPPLPSSTEPDEERTPGATSSFFSPGGSWTSSSTTTTGAGATGTGAQGLWNSSNWSARFSNFPQLIRMSTGASGTTTTGEGPLSPAAVVSAPPPAPSKAPAPARPSSERDSISAASIPATATATASSSSAEGSGTTSAPTSSSS